MTRTRQRYAPTGMLAVHPQAFGGMFDVESADMADMRGSVAVVSIRGPLMHHESYFFDSYDGIKTRVAAALSAQPKAVVLSIDSPGGLVAGCFEASRAIRAMAEESGVPLYAYCDGQASSAAYALACAASKIYAPPTAMVGSIGVLDAMVDATGMDAAAGLKFALVTSGARKADGNPHQPLTDDAIASAQARVDELAAMFFDLVAESRGLSVDAVRGLDAAQVTGAEAHRAGLVDALGTMDDLLAAIGSGRVEDSDMSKKSKPANVAASEIKAPVAAAAEEQEEELSPMERATALLREAAESDDEDTAKVAKRMLAAMEDGDDEEEETPADAPADDDEEEAAAASSDAARIVALEAENRVLLSRLERIEGSAEDREEARVSALVDGAIASGRILPVEREDFLTVARADYARAERMIGRAKAAVPTGRQVKSTGSASSTVASAEGLTELEEQKVKALVAMGWSRDKSINHVRASVTH